MEQALTMEGIKQSAKFGIGVTALIILMFINSNIHQLVVCLMRSPVDSVIIAPPANCTSNIFNYGLELKVDLCDTAIIFYIDKKLLRSFEREEATAFKDWLRRCTSQHPCPVTSSDAQCPAMSAFTESDYLCFDNNRDYLVINGFRLIHYESIDVIKFIE